MLSTHINNRISEEMKNWCKIKYPHKGGGYLRYFIFLVSG